jgi:serine/threonine protein kinase
MNAAVSPARRFTKYDIVRKLGRSMTDVYLAVDSHSGCQVILKLIEQSGDDYTNLVIQAEQRGAQIQADLHRIDPRILAVYECGFAENCFFVVMEYFEGKNIAELLQIERRLDPKRAAHYAAEICSQLQCLHSFVPDVDDKKHAVVHGDIKPSNIQIGSNGDVRLLDFGIAKVITYTRNLTQHNLGSPTYCSPERLAKGQVDAQADLWAVGVSLYEMVAGSPPYQAQNTRKLEALIESRRPPRSLPDTCPAGLAAVIKKALAPDIANRYDSAAEFESDLRAFIADRPTKAYQQRRPAWGNDPTVNKFYPEVIEVQPRKPFWRNGPKKLARTWGGIRAFNWVRAGSILFGVLSVFLLFYLFGRLRDDIWRARVPVDYSRAGIPEIQADWNRYQQLKLRDQFLGRFSPAEFQGQALRTSLLATADELLDGYRDSSEQSLANFDWAKAQFCLRHALEIQPGDRETLGKSALCAGYLDLVRNPSLPKASQSEPDFHQAATLMPRAADPHLALAHLYVYAYRNVGRAVAELRQAERLGFKPGPREMEEEADGYVYRAESQLRQARTSHDDALRRLRLATDDLARARNLYEPIYDFSNVAQNLKRMEEDQTAVDKLKSEIEHPPAPVSHSRHPRRR